MAVTRARSSSQVDRMFRAFADRTRLRILHLLRDGELCVSDIIEILRVPQAKASHHLHYLRKVGLVDVRKQGLWCFYRLRPAETPFHQKLLECLGQCFAGVPGLAADRARAAKVKASGGCCPKERGEGTMARRGFVAGLLLLGILVSIAAAGAQKDLDKAARQGKVAFIVVTDEETTGADQAAETAKQASKQVKKSIVVTLDRSDPANADLVAKYRLAGAPVPLILVAARNGVIAGGLAAAQATSDKLAGIVPSPKKAEILLQLQSGKAVLISATRKGMAKQADCSAACAAACGQLPDRCVTVAVDMEDPAEAEFLKSIKVDTASIEPVTLVLNAQGQITGTYNGPADVAALVQAATRKAGGCCPSTVQNPNPSCAPPKK